MHQWLKQAILLLFRLSKMETIELGPFEYADKIPLKTRLRGGRRAGRARARRPATGSFLEPGVMLMPSYVNIGARVGADTMVDTWATVGSCAQIGANVHLSGGVGIGGVLEPPAGRAGHRRATTASSAAAASWPTGRGSATARARRRRASSPARSR